MIARLATLFAVTIAAIGVSHAQGNNTQRAIGVLQAPGGDNTVRINAAMEGDKLPFLSEKEALKTRYSRLEQAAHEKDIQVASLGSLASEEPLLPRRTFHARPWHGPAGFRCARCRRWHR